MDDFWTDLDQVLDDFEKTEDTSSSTRPLPQAGVGPPVDPPSYHEIAGDFSATSLVNDTQNQFSSAFYQEVSSRGSDLQGVDPVDLKTVPGSGIFDMSEPGSDLNKNVQRLEQMGNSEFVNADSCNHAEVGLYAHETDMYSQPAAGGDVYPQVKSDEGHFIPDDVGQHVSGSPFGYESPLYDPQPINSQSEPFPTEQFHPTDSGTDILQAASELHAHIGDREDRPSFMSSSPPSLSAFHHPDIIPSSAESSQTSTENQSDSGVSSEQGEANGANAFMNTSPIHRSNPCMDNSGVPHLNSLHDIAQHSYTVPSSQDSSVTTTSVAQLDNDLVQNINDGSSNFNSDKIQKSDVCLPDEASTPMTFESGDFNVTNTAEHGGSDNSATNDTICYKNISNSSVKPVTPKQEFNSDPINLPLQQAIVQNPGAVQLNESSGTISDPELTPTGIPDSRDIECIDSLPTHEFTQSKDTAMQQGDSSSDVTPTNSNTYQEIPSLDKTQPGLGIMPQAHDSTIGSVEKLQTPSDVKESSAISQNKFSMDTEPSGAFSEPTSSSLISDPHEIACDTNAANVMTQLQSNELTMSEADMAAVDWEMAALEQEIATLKQGGSEVKDAINVSNTFANKTELVPSGDLSQANETQLMPSGDLSQANETQHVSSSRSSRDISQVNETQTESSRDSLTGSDRPQTVSGALGASHINAISTQTKPEQKGAISNTLVTPTSDSISSPEQSRDNFGKRRDSGESVERFLAPVLSPGIATPMDDPGFTKVPGFQTALDSMTEEDEQSTSKVNAAGANAICEVRPKEGTPEGTRRNRPNSLLGLSKPDMPLARPIADCGAYTHTAGLNPLYDVINKENTHKESDNSASNNSDMIYGNTDSTSVDSNVNNSEQTMTNILRPKTLTASGQSSETSAQVGAFPPGALTLAFPPHTAAPNPTTFSGAHARPASWPVQEVSEPAAQAQKQRRPNSLNLPSRGGSISPSQPLPPSPMMGVEAAPEGGDAAMAVTPVTPAAEVESAAEAVEGATGYSQEPTAQETSSSADSLITVPTITSPGRTPGTVLPPQSSSNPMFAITDLGKLAPDWVPDAEAPNCMECELRFTFTKRRHHCRACGKVFCSNCCYLKSKLQYLDNKEARVCSKCYQDLIRAVVFERMSAEEGATVGASNMAATTPAPNPNNPSEYCSTVPPMQQAQANANTPPPSVMVPVGVLRKEGSLKRENSKKVIFSDGIRPGGDLTEIDGSAEVQPSYHRSGRRARRVDRSSDSRSKSLKAHAPSVTASFVPHTGLPPSFMGLGDNGEFLMEPNRNITEVMAQINAGENILQFVLNKNLLVLVKLVTLECCVNKTCWCLTTKGMCTVAQDEMVVLLEVFPDEDCLPIDLFQHFQTVYEQAAQGHPVSNMDHTIFTQGFLDSRDHGGFLYLRPTFQCLNKLIIPEAPYVFAVLLQKWETPWAKVFPLRLLLRLGAEFRYYPCPLVSVRFRKPVFGEIGHTIMNVLVDFRNYKYVIPRVRGLTIYMRDKRTYITLPRNRYDDIMRALSSSTEQVLALAANFSKEADSYLVCIQNDQGNYETQAINIHNKPRQVTGASFVVFNANVKQSDGIHAKSSIVEDGLMVQILPDTMLQLREALRQMREYSIEYGGVRPSEPQESVLLQWQDSDKDFNVGVVSPIDAFPMDGVVDVHIHNAVDYLGQANKAIRWTQVFFLQSNEETARVEAVDLSRLAEALSQALCVALSSKLDKLCQAGYHRLGLRATISSDNVGYEVGSNSEKLPDLYMNELDNELIPVIHSAAANNKEGPVVLELIFHVINTEVLYKST